jgi:hypothetical protein
VRRGRDLKILENGQEKFIGFILEADFTAEHEFGIEELKSTLGIPSKISWKMFGLRARTITKYDERCLYLSHEKKHSLLTFEENNPWKRFRTLSDEELHPYKDDQAVCAWDGGSFGIVVTSEHIQILEDLKEAFEHKDIAIWLGKTSNNPFEKPGLIIAIASRVSKESRKLMRDSDIDYLKLMSAFRKTGIEALLKIVGKGYYCLAPKWRDNGKKELVFWLNPHEQKKYNAGWFALPDLIDWAHNKGPVIKSDNE